MKEKNSAEAGDLVAKLRRVVTIGLGVAGLYGTFHYVATRPPSPLTPYEATKAEVERLERIQRHSLDLLNYIEGQLWSNEVPLDRVDDVLEARARTIEKIIVYEDRIDSTWNALEELHGVKVPEEIKQDLELEGQVGEREKLRLNYGQEICWVN